MNLFKRTKLIQECQLLTGKGGGGLFCSCVTYIYMCTFYAYTQQDTQSRQFTPNADSHCHPKKTEKI